MPTRWDDRSFTSHVENIVWTASPTVRRYLHRIVSGHPDCDWLTFVEANHLPAAVDRALVLGCGSGWLERALAGRGRFREIVGCDFAPSTIERARTETIRNGHSNIEHYVVDLERDSLPGGPYGAVFANDVLHHVTNLESLYERIRERLEPDGKFIFNEYIGPNRFQFPDGQMDLVNRYMRVLPDRLRFSPSQNAVLWRKNRLSPELVAREDPTEAVRSEEVVPVARRFFEAEAEYPYGGSLLNTLLYEIVVNFDEDDPQDTRLLQMLCDAEDRLIQSGHLVPDFWIFVGSPLGRGSHMQDAAGILP